MRRVLIELPIGPRDDARTWHGCAALPCDNASCRSAYRGGCAAGFEGEFTHPLTGPNLFLAGRSTYRPEIVLELVSAMCSWKLVSSDSASRIGTTIGMSIGRTGLLSTMTS